MRVAGHGVNSNLKLQVINAAAAKMFGNPDMHLLYGAPTFVIVSIKSENETPGNLEFSNAAIMAHNMALAAVDFGMGCCYIWGGDHGPECKP